MITCGFGSKRSPWHFVHGIKDIIIYTEGKDSATDTIG
jgi:hypothetical protein